MRWALPHLVTCGNLASGFLAVLLIASGDFLYAAAFVLVAAILDLLDGAIARNACEDDDRLSEFGKNLDSLADVVSFGVAPAFAAYATVLHTLPVAGIAGCLAFFVCGALRLARFPLVGRPDRFVGLPIPPAGLLVAALAALGPPPLLVLAALAATSALMVSTLPFPTPASFFGPKKPRHDAQPQGDCVAADTGPRQEG
ncbi:MAG: CDP-diacylglycerol--serine O-phosphatidyltransferase [Rubrobacter sp.]|nr:CDP-diacylglycerol--serine O-phosphatidyltransferase [Rubrobacteraceae bacterium]MBA3793839.1 CDP-diacylglycerol--serine O-phosphatidyltransferase [Rubrobacter sp.]